MSKRKYYFTIAGLSAILIVGAYISIHIGSVKIPLSVTFQALCTDSKLLAEKFPELDLETTFTILKEIRFPRVLAAIICGLALSISGAAYQSMFRNPLVSPDLLGVLAGAACGALLGMMMTSSFLGAQVGAFIFGVLAVLLAMGLAMFFTGNRLVMLIMGGVISSSLFSSILSIIKYAADAKEKLPSIVFWLMGGFSNISSESLYLVTIIILVGSFLLILMSGQLNLLSMGDEEAQTLGVNVHKTRNIIIMLTTAISASTVALGGMIGWVGLMIPHIARMITGPDNRQLLPVAGLIGAIYLLVVDDLCRCGFDTEIPIGIVTSLLGVPFFIFVTYKTSK
ncbi:MAG: iron ABC transporter permease [Candidatus Riflebacteria bacterium]|nr:iron ABC transporter permease [Candidatus Riflebacteria bacterium]